MIKQIVFIIVPAILIALILFVLFLSEIPSLSPVEGEISEVEIIDPVPEMLAEIEKQARIDDMLLAELESGQHSFDDPLIIVNPYGKTPLVALMIFTSDEPLQIALHITGKTKLADVDYTFDSFNTNHMIPIYGLYPGVLNNVEICAKSQNGETKKNDLEIETDPLPPDLAINILKTDLLQSNNYQTGFNFTYNQKSAFDVNGDYRWFYNDFDLGQTTLTNYHGNMLFVKGATWIGDVLIFEINALGKILSVYYSPYGAHHDIAVTDNESLLVTGSAGSTKEDVIYEIDTQSGNIINFLDLKNVLPRTRYINSELFRSIDWFHNNTVVYDDGSIIISGRHQSAVAKMTWPDGNLEWILAEHVGWDHMFEKYLLTPIGDDFEWSYGQHAPLILPDFDNNPDTIDILLFDNGNNRFDNDRELQRMIDNGEIAAPENYSRIVHYRINERRKTIEQIWEFGRELGETYFSLRCGNAGFLENGNRLGTFDRYLRDFYDINTNLVEVDINGNIVWEAYLTSTGETGAYPAYRADRLPLYTSAANDLRIGIPAKNLIPKEKLR